MQRISGLLFLLLIVGAGATLNAQQASRKSAKVLRREFSLLLPFTPTVTGAPFTAEYEIQVQQPLGGGGSETWQSTTLVARDSSGRIRHELHDYVPASFTKEPPLQSVILTDPVARLRHTLDPVRKTDDRQWFHVSHSSRLERGSSPGQDLGTKTMNGLEVRGELNTWTVFPRPGASGQTARVVDEIWYSDERHLIVFEQQKDSAGGVFTIAMSKFDGSEPPASLFKAPRGYHLPIPPGRGPVAPAINQPNYDPSVGPPSGAW
jgi:hypothetical protein